MTFFKKLKKNNNRDWFNQHKDEYENNVKQPLFNFLSDLSIKLCDVTDDYLSIPKVNGGSVFRIYRDTRFSKDKTPYKTHAAAQLKHVNGKDVHAPGFYFHFEPNNMRIGGGIWKPEAQFTKNIRLYIQDQKQDFLKILKNKKFKDTFDSILPENDTLVNVPKYITDSKDIENYLRLKSWFIMQEISDEDFLSDKILKLSVQNIKTALPLLDFLYRGTLYNKE